MPPHRSVLVCKACSTLEPINTPHGDGCNSREWLKLPLVQDLGLDGHVTMQHGHDGWPEIRVTKVYLVRSDDRDLVEQEMRRLVAEEGDRIE